MLEEICILIQEDIQEQIKFWKKFLVGPCIQDIKTKARISEVILMLEQLYRDFEF